jgi:hypothetical protein
VGLFITKTLQLSTVQLILGLFMFWALLAHPNEPICYRYTDKPLPHQRFARGVFYAAAIVLTLGGFWGLWIEWRLTH